MTNIPFKAVAVDMDGTFVNSENTYDHKRFRKVLTQLRKHGVHFIVASGRPFHRLKEDFGEFLDKINLICDNGCILVRDNKIIRTITFSNKASIDLLKYIQSNYPQASTIACGLKQSYIFDNASPEFRRFMKFYYPNAIYIKRINDIPKEEVFDKITIWDPADATLIEESYNKQFNERIHATSSGFNCTDIIPECVNKASSLKYFLDYFKISPAELIAFGDGMNDLEMLKLAGYSYVMENGEDELKRIAKYEAPNNNDSGVLQILENYLND